MIDLAFKTRGCMGGLPMEEEEKEMHGNPFEEEVARVVGEDLVSIDLDILQVNLGLRCNQACRHCHVNASPRRTEQMERPIMDRVVKVARENRCKQVDVTGGAPELHPEFRWFVRVLREEGHDVQVRTNLTVLLEPGMEDLPEFFREHRVRLVASMPCYLEENVHAQRGKDVYERSVSVLRRLNGLGYGNDPDLPLKIVYNPGGSFLPPVQAALEEDYRRELSERFGIAFTGLITIINMPIGRFLDDLRSRNEEEVYRRLLRESFNPDTIEALMCRHQISVGWDGRLFDCDFNLALGLPVNHGAPNHIMDFDPSVLFRRRIVTGMHCFGCTAGSGSSCGGALVKEKV